MEGGFVTEIPSYLKQLARLISYAFYQIEDTLIVDMLVRHPCKCEKFKVNNEKPLAIHTLETGN